MKKFAFTILLASCCFVFSNAQDYNTGIGFRGGFSNGITIKHFISPTVALEGIISSRWRGVELTGLYELHIKAFQTERLKWYVGFGGHVGFYDGKYTSNNWGTSGNTYTVVGLDGILGLEYSFVGVPINISVDWKPAFNFAGHSGFWADGGAISIRYIF
jgi:hypothetical protein